MSWILGLNAYHGDSSACLFHEGRLVAAAEEERFNRLKHWSGFPGAAIRFCLAAGGISLAEVEHVALNRKPWASLGRKLWFTLTTRPEAGLIGRRASNARQWLLLKDQFHQAFGDQAFKARVHFIEHHQAHLASSFFVSPMETAALLSLDGFGDFSSAAWGVGTGKAIKILDRIYFPHSLGLFYLALTQYLGFPNYGDEYKVMGLAAYGRPTYEKEMAELVRLLPGGKFQLNLRYFCHHSQNIAYEWDNTVPIVGQTYSADLVGLLGPARLPEEPVTERHMDLAHSLQTVYERAFFHVLRHLHRQTGLDRLCLAGGCAMNSVANGKIRRQTPFRELYIQSAPGDAGGAIGAALAVWHQVQGQNRDFVMEHAFWGPSYSNGAIQQAIAARSADLQEQGCSWELVPEEDSLLRRTAAAVAAGQVVGFFQGRMEWGPRALGNRSILGDPRRPDMKDILNLKIKHRESFRPFAPSILREAVAEYFEQDDNVPFMLQVFKVRPEKRSIIPAVTHVDGSGRLQTVSPRENPRYYRLIQCFREITGLPLVLNTSFNENEPVVNRPEEALDCFLRTKMDILVLEDFFISRADGA
jgi:carbamoyltransferase